MGILKFGAVCAMDNVGHRFGLSQIHLAVQEGSTGVFTGFSQANPLDATNRLQQIADNQRISVRVKFQDVFAGVGIRRFEVDVQEAIEHLARLRIASGPKVRHSRHQVFSGTCTE